MTTLKNTENIIRRLLHPSSKVILITDTAAALLLAFSLSFLDAQDAVSLAAYLFSTFALVLSLLNVSRLTNHIKSLIRDDRIYAVRQFKTLMRRRSFTARYLESRDLRAEVSVYTGLAANLVFAVFKSVSGVYYHSSWLISVGVYYLVSGAIRFMLMVNLRLSRESQSAKKVRIHGYRTARSCGLMMFILNLAVAGMAYRMIEKNDTNHYSRLVAVVTAAYTFYFCIKAVVSAAAYRKNENAILAAAKKLNISSAALSMFVLQTAMIHTFDSTHSSSVREMNMITGVGAMAVMIWNALSMTAASHKRLKNIEREE